VAGAENPDDYCHRGAQHYIFGEKAKARAEVEIGQGIFPNDPKLNALALLLKKEEAQKQQGKQKKKGQKGKQKQGQNSSGQSDEKGDQQDGKKQEDDRKKGGEKKEDQGPDGEQKKQERTGEGRDEQDADSQVMFGQLTLQQALQLLDSQKGEERALIFQPAQQQAKPKEKKFKDW
jgi:Ca-activated chloride channel family protein